MPTAVSKKWPGTELARSGRFVDVQQSILQRRRQISANDYVGYLSTVSAYLVLPDPVRRQVSERIIDVLPQRVTVVSDLTIHLARKR